MSEPIVLLTRAFESVSTLLLESWNELGILSDTNQLSLSIPPALADSGLSYREQLAHGTGSFRLKKWPYRDTDYTHLITGFEYIQPLFDYAAKNGWKACRPMIRCLNPKTCLSYHADDAECRFHIPLSTTWQAFFVVQDKVFRMQEVGSLYSLTTNVLHTAVNANLTKPRIHFTFSVYKESK